LNPGYSVPIYYSKNKIIFVEQFEMESVSQMMKKINAIFLAVLMFTALFHFSIATHYCGGTIAATKISLSGKLASCGMESDGNSTVLPGLNFVSHCCENSITFCGVVNNYQPTFSYLPEVYRDQITLICIPEIIIPYSPSAEKPICINASPPGKLSFSAVDLTDICVYRI
jgi:hypothetical protein